MSRDSWNRWHQAGQVESTSPEGLSNLHEVAHLFIPGAKFLDVGVGAGAMAKWAVSKGLIVDCVDVADRAYGHVKGVCRDFYLASILDLMPAGEYDFALSHLVAQHMTDAELCDQIREVLRALKQGGIFSIQFAGSDLPGEIQQQPSDICVGHMIRSPEEADALCRLSGGTPSLIRDTERWDHSNTGPQTYYYYLHVRRDGE